MALAAETRRRAARAGLAVGLGAMCLAMGCATQPEPLAPGAMNTGTYPNLNVPPPVAAPQLSAEDQAAKRTELSAAQVRQAGAAGSGTSAAEQARLRLLAQEHGQQTLNAIEGPQ